MKLEPTNTKKQYVQPKIKVCMIEASDIIATSGDPDEIYPKLND